ncbi:MAG: LysR substrate-binding domain-containing protein [Pseudomonadota bacterium]|nr:LysR substrate-binding domain-containing protein [Pseudomonadota bacterium]
MAALPSLRQLSYLVALAETLHFTEAAKHCFVTQSTLSGGIMELERMLGGVLVERTRQQVRLTPLGEQVVARARLMLADAHDLMRLSRELSEPLTGDLHLGVIPTIAPFILSALLSAVRQDMPRLNLHLHELQSQVAVEQLLDGRLDMVLLALPFATEGLYVEPLCPEPLYWVTHHDDPAFKTTQHIDDLPLDRLLLLEEGHCLRDHALSACPLGDQAGLSGLEASSLPTLMQMVHAQLGSTLLPEMAVRSGFVKAHAGLVSKKLDDAPERTLALLVRKSSTQMLELERLSVLVRSLLLQNMQPHPPSTF